MKKQINFENSRGQLLVESMIALTIIIVGTLGALVFLNRALSLNRVVSDQYIATYLAAEGIEIASNLIYHNRNSSQPFNSLGFDTNSSYEVEYNTLNLQDSANLDRFLRFDPATGIYSYNQASPIITPFKRRIDVKPITQNASVNEVQVNSIVTWQIRGGGTFEINLEDHLLNWKKPTS